MGFGRFDQLCRVHIIFDEHLNFTNAGGALRRRVPCLHAGNGRLSA